MTIPETPPTAAAPAPVKSAGILVLIWLILTQLASALALFLVGAFVVFGAMLEGWSFTYMSAIVLVLLLGIIPFVAAWKAYKRGKGWRAFLLTSLPLALSVLIVAFVAVFL